MFFQNKDKRQEAEQAFAAGKWKKALSIYQEIEKQGFDAKVFQRIADLYRKCDDPEQAVIAYKRLARHYAKEGFWAKAMSVSKMALDLAPNDAELEQSIRELHFIKFGADTKGAAPDKLSTHSVPPSAAIEIEMSSGTQSTSRSHSAEMDSILGQTVDIDDMPCSTLGQPISGKIDIPLFSELSANEFSALLASLTVRNFPKDAYIVEEGDLGETMFLITDGRVEVSIRSETQGEVVVGRLGGGEFFGEQSLLDRTPRSASVRAQTDVELLELDAKQLAKLAKSHPNILKAIRHFIDIRLIERLLIRSKEFLQLGPEERKLLAEKMLLQHVRADQILIEEGQTGEQMFFIRTGIFDVITKRTGSHVLIASLEPGHFFGEVGMLTGRPRTCTVKARTDSQVYVLNRADAAAILRGNVSVLKLLQEVIKDRSADMAETIKSIREASVSLDLL